MITKSVLVEYHIWQAAIQKAGWKGNIHQIINELLRLWVLDKIKLEN